MTPEPPPSLPPRSLPPAGGSKFTRPLFFVAGLMFVGLGILGYMLPVMPGTIFLILAAGCFARSSRRLEAWIENHPKYGPTVVAWRRHGAIPRKAKYLSIGMMALSFVIVIIAHPPALWFWLTGAVLLACALFVATRPEGPKTTG
ncbi:MAG TPA: YbaN family protein [Hyphomonadaceae bacterium]|mgnify:FL=1|nr:YbaN family protein [Hyphomonadaceae bacterium]HPN05232.1 YbaN family protein [Hyphomonadaceae bacterium]